MKRTCMEAIQHRRTYYSIDKKSPVNDSEIEEVIRFAVTHVPSAFNSQTARIVLLLHNHHVRLWDIVKETLRKIVPADSFKSTEEKVNSFQAGYGSVLFFEDQETVQSLQKQFPAYSEKFPVWSQHTSAMHQFVIWTNLEDLGFGASLQHYNPLIDEDIRKTWNIPATWSLVAQMPFGLPTAPPGDKTFKPIDERLLVFK